MDKSIKSLNEQNTDEKRKQKLEKMLRQLEDKRNILNQVAEKQYEENGDLSNVVFCEEQNEFNRISNKISSLLNEIHSIQLNSDEESEKNK